MYILLLNQWLMTKVIFPKYYHYKYLPFSYILLVKSILLITVIQVVINILTKYFFLFLQLQKCNIYSTVRQVKSRCWTIKKKSDSSGRHLTLTRIKVTISSCHLLYLKRSFTNTAFNNKPVTYFHRSDLLLHLW